MSVGHSLSSFSASSGGAQLPTTYIQVGEARDRHRWRVLTTLAAAVQLAFLAVGLSMALPAVPARAATFAPYLDMTLHDDPGLPAVRRETGARLVSLGFVI